MDLRAVRLYFVLLFAAVGLGLTGCNRPKAQLERFNQHFQAGRYDAAARFADEHIRPERARPGGEDLLWTLQLGSVERLRGNFERSTEYFDLAEQQLGYFDTAGRAVGTVAAMVSTDNVLPYSGSEYDRVMVNTYKALNFMVADDRANARVEFNRALDRQRRAAERFAGQIERLREEIDSKEASSPARLKRTIDNPELMERIYARYSNLREYEVYPDFVNPFTTYLAGIFFTMDGDLSRAADMFRESHGMVPDNQYIAEDLVMVERALDTGGQAAGNVWVIFENGLGPIKREWRVDLPLFLASDQVRYVGIALPRLDYRAAPYGHLRAQSAQQAEQTALVSSMDRVVQTEFKAEFNAILLRSVAATTLKTVAQYRVQRQLGEPAAALMAIYSAATTAADVRIWSTLPKEFQVARLDMPSDGAVKVIAGAREMNIELGECENALIYVIIPNRQAEPVHAVVEW